MVGVRVSRRREMIAGAAAALAAVATRGSAAASPRRPARVDVAGFDRAVARLEAQTGGRLGLAVLDTGSGIRLGRRRDERFAMASTFKVFLAATVLDQIDTGRIKPDQRVAYSRADLLAYAPVTAARVAEGSLPVLDLCAAAVEESDNTAANLLLTLVGGPAAVTARLRALGDGVTRLDRSEPALNTNLPGDPRDTSTPAAFVETLDRLLLGPGLSAAGRARLTGWLVACRTGRERLRAGLPADWKAGDKTGTGDRGAVNDVAILWPPGRAPVLVAAFLDGSSQPTARLSEVHVALGALVATTVSNPPVRSPRVPRPRVP